MKPHLNDAELQLYLDGRLEERETLDHLRGCPLCQERLDRYEPLFAALATEPEWSPSPDLADKVMRKIRRDSLGPLSENLLHSLLLIGGIIAAFRLASPFLHPESYLKGVRGLSLPETDLSWEWLKALNLMPRLEEYFRGTNLPVNSLVLFGGAILLVLLLDQLIGLARRHNLPQSR